jgi:cell division protein FtsB
VNIELNIWDKLTRVVKFLLFVAGLLAVAIWYLPLVQQNERMRKEILRLDTQIQKKEELGKQMKNSVQALSHDSKAIERLAREQFGYGKPGETVIRFEAPATNTAPHP